MSLESLIPLLVILPLAGFASTALIGRRLGKQAHWIPVIAILAVWLIAMAVSFAALTGAEPFGEHGYGATLFDWIPAGAFHVEAGFFVDQRLMVAGLGGLTWMSIGVFIMAKMVNFEI